MKLSKFSLTWGFGVLGLNGDVETFALSNLELQFSFVNKWEFVSSGKYFKFLPTPICTFAVDSFGYGENLVRPELGKFHWEVRTASIGYTPELCQSSQQCVVALLFKNRFYLQALCTSASPRTGT